MDYPLISVIVPVYRAEAYLDHCVRSLVNQTYRNLEIILVNDGSPDNCAVICDAWARKDARIRAVHTENRGPSNARNIGIHLAKGEWIVFADADDVLSVHLIQALIDHQPDCSTLCVSNYSRFSKDLPADLPPQPPYYAPVKNFASLRSGHYCWAILYNRKIILENGIEFPTSLHNLEDVVWNTLYLLHTEKILFNPTPLYYYRHTASSITSHCNDHRWQANAWNNARNAITHYILGLPLSKSQKRQIVAAFRLCQNNLFAECHVGALTYSDYQHISSAPEFSAKSIPVFSIKMELALLSTFSHSYYMGYSLLMKLRYALSSRRSSLAK